MSSTLFFFLGAAFCGGFGVILRAAIGGRRALPAALAVVALAGGIALGIASIETGAPAALALCALVAGMLVVRIFDRWYHQRLRTAVETAADLRDFALGNFAWLDADGDGLVTRVDIYNRQNDPSVPDRDRSFLILMDWYLDRIGHVVDTRAIPSPMMGHVVHYTHYGISEADLETYPERIAAEYEREFGPIEK